jgi:hypothetical protein
LFGGPLSKGSYLSWTWKVALSLLFYHFNTHCDTMADDNYARDEEDFDEEEVDETVSNNERIGDSAVYMRNLPTDPRFDNRATDQSKMPFYLQSILAAQC